MLLRREQRLDDLEPAVSMQVEDVDNLRVEAFVRPVQLAALHDEHEPQQRSEREEQNQRTTLHSTRKSTTWHRQRHGNPVPSSVRVSRPGFGSQTLTVSPPREASYSSKPCSRNHAASS